MIQIHPTIAAAAARVAASATVGQFSIVSELAKLHDNVKLDHHVVVLGDTEIGSNTRVHSFACLGDGAQNKREPLQGLRPPALRIGKDCVIREHVTVHCSTMDSPTPTRIGNGVWLLAGSHVGHDAEIRDHALISNGTQIAGHVLVQEYANIGGLCGIQQFCVIGRGAMVGGGSMVDRHVPPYSLVLGNRAHFHGINIRGLKRRGVPAKQISSLVQVARRIYKDGCEPRQVLEESSGEKDGDACLAIEFAQFICDAGRVTPTWCARRSSMGVVKAPPLLTTHD